MAGGVGLQPLVRPDDGLGRFIYAGERVLRPIENATNLIAAVAVLFIMVLGCLQIVMRMRFLFNAPLYGYIDMIGLVMPILAVLGISYAQRYGVHIRMDILVERLRGRTLWLVETFNSLAALVIATLLMVFSGVFFWSAYTSGDSTVDAEILTWPSKILVPLALAVLVLRLVVQLLGSIRLVIDPSRPLIGVVAPMDVAAQAQAEIEALGDAGVSRSIANEMSDRGDGRGHDGGRPR